MKKKKIVGGVYLVVDPTMRYDDLVKKLLLLQSAPLAAVQLWDNPAMDAKNEQKVLGTVCDIFEHSSIPLLVNNKLEWLDKYPFDGVHFDTLPMGWEERRKSYSSSLITGATLNNDLRILTAAAKANIDYVSFCSMFPSVTSNSCDLVSFENVKKARQMSDLPVFLAGGISPETMPRLAGLPFDGIAVVSGIMKSDSPLRELERYLEHLNK